LDENGGGGSEEESVSELEKDMLLAFEGQEKSSATASSSQNPRHSVEPPHPQQHDQSVTGYGKLQELRHGTPLRSQDQGEEPKEQLQQQEVAVEAMREEEDDGDNEEREPQGEKRGRQDRNEEISSDDYHSEGNDCSHNTSNEDGEDPRPARRWKLLPRFSHQPLSFASSYNPNAISDSFTTLRHPQPRNLRWTMCSPSAITDICQLP
jgi:hypothetical protein